MKILVSKTQLVLTLSILWTASANQACFATRGDIIAHNVPQATVHTYRVSGWQNQLTSANPNLGNYYWEPLTRRIINTTGTTSRGATAAPPILANRTSRYVKPMHVALPINNAALLQTNAVELPCSSSGPSQCAKTHTTLTTLTYRNSKSWSDMGQPDLTTVSSYSAKESVYGVVKATSLRTAR